MNIQENITKFTNLDANDSLSAFKGNTAQQFHGAYEVFYEFLKQVRPNQILEIGTALGGFTQFLKLSLDNLGLSTKILSYDIAERPWYKDIINLGVDVRVEDVFDFTNFTVKSEVIDFIKQDGITIVLCDGGWKIGEFKVLSEHIKSGDFILAHDYAENKEVFDSKINGKVWNWHEIQDSDISEASDKNNLLIYNKETFENVAWTCRVKK
jgi:cephalosporin hydroxylase